MPDGTEMELNVESSRSRPALCIRMPAEPVRKQLQLLAK